VTLRVVVVGPGAVGTFLGAVLARGGADVTLLGRGDAAPARARLVLEDPDGPATVDVTRATAGEPPGVEPDLVVLAVKAFDLAEGLATAARWPQAALLTVQNGVGAEAAAAAARTSPIIAGSLTAAVVPVPGGVRRLRRGGLGLAAVRDETPRRLAAVAAAFAEGGLATRVYPDPVAMKWSKLVANVVGNASGAILDMDPQAIYRDPRSYEVERRQLLEVRAVMRALGARPVNLPGAGVRLLLLGARLPAWLGRPLLARGVGGARGGKSPSLRLHVRGGEGRAPQPGPTEVGWLNGEVAREASRRGVSAPVNAALARLVESVASDPERAAWFAGRPDRLLAAVEGRPDATPGSP
jgi:2-dehydropantoate 2-reductase